MGQIAEMVDLYIDLAAAPVPPVIYWMDTPLPTYSAPDSMHLLTRYTSGLLTCISSTLT